MIKIVVDSACDILRFDQIQTKNIDLSFFTEDKVQLSLAPLTISTDERSFLDDENLDVHEMLEYLASYKGRSYTACPSIDAWMQAFEGGDEIYVLPLTSGLSGTYNSAVTARELYLQDHPDVKIQVFDTLTASAELRLYLEKIMELIQAGSIFDEITYYTDRYMRSTHLLFAFESLHNFAQNGRVSKVVASATNMLGIRIIGTASPAGTIEVVTKARGEKKTAVTLLKELDKINFSKGKIRIAHTENESFANVLKNKVQEKYPEADVIVYDARGLCSYYGEAGGIFMGMEVE